MYTIAEVSNQMYSRFYSAKPTLLESALRRVSDLQRAINATVKLSKKYSLVVFHLDGQADGWYPNQVDRYYVNGEIIPAEDVKTHVENYTVAGLKKYEVWNHSPQDTLGCVNQFFTLEAAMHEIRDIASRYHWYYVKCAGEVLQYYCKDMNKPNAQTYDQFVAELKDQHKQAQQALFAPDKSQEYKIRLLNYAASQSGLDGLHSYLDRLRSELQYISEHGNQVHKEAIDYLVSLLVNFDELYGDAGNE